MAVYLPAVTEHCNPPVTAAFAAGTDDVLITAYPFVVGIKDPEVLRYFMDKVRPKFAILDSGIFTLYRDYGGSKATFSEIDRYADRYLNFVQGIKWPFPFVEVDTQNLPGGIGVEHFRSKLIDRGIDDQAIHVWHLPDGPQRFREMCQRFRRVSASPRELIMTHHGVDRYNQMIRGCRDVLRGRHLHCLGSAEEAACSLPDWASFDTSSWSSSLFWGSTRAGFMRVEIRDGKLITSRSIIDRIRSEMDHMLDVYKNHPERQKGKKVRWQYLAQVRASLLATVLHFKSVRMKGARTDLNIHDPIEYWRTNEVTSSPGPH